MRRRMLLGSVRCFDMGFWDGWQPDDLSSLRGRWRGVRRPHRLF